MADMLNPSQSGLGMHGHGRSGHGGRWTTDTKRSETGHPIFTRRRSSRRLFKEFLRDRRWFGLKPPDAESPPPAADAETDGPTPASTDNRTTTEPTSRPWRRRAHTIARYFSVLHDFRLRLLLLMFLSLLTVTESLIMPWVTKFVVDDILPRKDFSLLAWLCVGLLAVTLLAVGIRLLEGYVSRSLLGAFVNRMKRLAMRHLQRLPLERLQELKVGGIVSRLQSDTEGMRGLFRNVLLVPFQALAMLVLALVSMAIMNWQVTLVCLAFSVLIVGCALAMFTVMMPFRKALREETAGISAHLTETFGGIQVVRAFQTEKAEARAYAVTSHLNWRKTLYGDVADMLVHRSVGTVHGLLVVAVWLSGGYFYIQGSMKLGELMAFFFLINLLFGPVFMIVRSMASMQTTLACTERVFDLLDEPIGTPDSPNAVPVTRRDRTIEFRHVTFDYPDGTRALTELDLTIEHGKMTALVGPSGAGKSTTINLLMRFYDVSDGAVTVDGTDVRDVTLASYRRLFGLVLQDVFLFDGTLFENIAYGRPDAGRDQVEAAARAANAHEFVARLDKGYDAVIGERGIKLSAGQRQRVSLARAILLDPQILVLDEATSSVDSESEALIQQVLRDLFRGRTTVAIAHRLSTVLDADRIVVLDKGRKVEEGRHGELLRQRGRYHELYTKQMEKAERHKQVLDWNDDDSTAGLT